MEIINLHKRCNKKGPQPKTAPKSFKSDETKKAPKLPKFIDDPSKKGQKPKKASRTATRLEKKLKRPHS